MRNFLLKCSFPGVIFLSLFLTIEYFAGQERNLYFRKKEIFEKGGFSAHVVGSSHAFYGIVANGSSHYNFAWPSQALEESTFLVTETSPSVTNFLTISPFTFRTSNLLRKESWRNVYFHRVFRQFTTNKFKDYFFIFAQGGQKSIAMARNGFNEIGQPKYEVNTGNGRRGAEHSSEVLTASAIAAAGRHLNNPMDKSLMLKLEALAIEGQELQLITTPFHQAYLDIVEKDAGWLLTKQFCKHLSEEFPNVEYHDFSNFELPDSGFYDADHLNRTKAEIFSKILFKYSAE